MTRLACGGSRGEALAREDEADSAFLDKSLSPRTTLSRDRHCPPPRHGPRATPLRLDDAAPSSSSPPSHGACTVSTLRPSRPVARPEDLCDGHMRFQILIRRGCDGRPSAVSTCRPVLRSPAAPLKTTSKAVLLAKEANRAGGRRNPFLCLRLSLLFSGTRSEIVCPRLSNLRHGVTASQAGRRRAMRTPRAVMSCRASSRPTRRLWLIVAVLTRIATGPAP
ncbi:hypothetical protein CDD83_1837 [Cordyceps sp. RAO-2017]|nr:hypothetical protein CDD83_1837 [Cordyceps sp. RAO-2017]